MRAISIPNYDPMIVFQTCVNSISDENLRNRLSSLSNNIETAASNYQSKALSKQLYTFPAINCKNSDIALGSVTKQELTDVYSNQMVKQSKPARFYYDSLLQAAPRGRCPFCGMGQATTLDHYLPKSKYPQLSVIPLNLVPCCKDCNVNKRSAVAVKAMVQSLHPYFDHQNFINDQWLFAEVIHTKPASIKFLVQAPSHWDQISQARVQSHFSDYKLAARYSIEASNEIACLKDVLSQYINKWTENEIRDHLIIQANSYLKQHRNSWQTAMFQSLANSNWYCRGGFFDS